MRRRVVPLAAALIFAVVSTAACGGDDSAGPSSPSDVTGTWNASGTSAGSAFAITFTLTQTGTTVTGTGQVISGPGGPITGTVSGNRFNFQFTVQPPCAGSFTGTATVANTQRQMTGSIQGTDCLGPRTATFTAQKQ